MSLDGRDSIDAETGGDPTEAELRQEVRRLGERVAELEARSVAGVRGQWGLLPMLLTLLLVVAVGIGGNPLPRQRAYSASLLVDMAVLYNGAGKTDEALRVLNEAVETGILNAETLDRAGQIYNSVEQYGRAVELFREAVHIQPENADYGLALARSLAQSGQHKQAIAVYEQLVESSPGGWQYLRELGRWYEDWGDLNQALAQYDRLIDMGVPDGHFDRAVLLSERLGQCERAIPSFQRALQAFPNNYWVLVPAGRCLMDVRDTDQAIKLFKAALKVAPAGEVYSVYHQLGEAFLAQGSFTQAAEMFQESVKLEEDWYPGLIGLGKSYLGLGDCGKAVPPFQEALRLSQGGGEAKEGLQACQQ